MRGDLLLGGGDLFLGDLDLFFGDLDLFLGLLDLFLTGEDSTTRAGLLATSTFFVGEDAFSFINLGGEGDFEADLAFTITGDLDLLL